MRFSKFFPLSFTDVELIKAKAYEVPGREACGILVGEIHNDVAYVEQVRPIKNISETNDSFMMDPQEYLAAIVDTNFYTNQPVYQLLGIYHTHPNFPGYPSSIDWKAADKGQVVNGMYLIFTTEGDNLYSYYWDGKQFIVLRMSHYEMGKK